MKETIYRILTFKPPLSYIDDNSNVTDILLLAYNVTMINESGRHKRTSADVFTSAYKMTVLTLHTPDTQN